jgi:hypothetical protein
MSAWVFGEDKSTICSDAIVKHPVLPVPDCAYNNNKFDKHYL